MTRRGFDGINHVATKGFLAPIEWPRRLHTYWQTVGDSMMINIYDVKAKLGHIAWLIFLFIGSYNAKK